MSSLARALAVVGQVAEHGPLTAEDIAAGTDLPLSTTYRHITALLDLGYLTRRAGRYELGRQAAELVRQVNWGHRSDRLTTVLATVGRIAPSTPGPLLHRLAEQVVDALDAPQETPTLTVLPSRTEVNA